jgi:hypothetical protein
LSTLTARVICEVNLGQLPDMEVSMKWWLTVFFLIGNQWVSGDSIDGWGSRAFLSQPECEQRRHFAETQAQDYPFEVAARWTCNPGKPATTPPPPTLDARRDQTMVQTQGTSEETAPPKPLHPGLRLFTHADETWIKADAIGLRFTGPLTPPLAENLRDLLLSDPQVYDHVVLELDSPGGELGYVGKIVEVLSEVRKRSTLVTRVMGAQVCASGCVAVYMQGETRRASGASVWVFHGACTLGSNIPSPLETEDFLKQLETSGVDPQFLCDLRDKGYVSKPGNLFLSGYEIFHVSRSGIIQELLPSWQPEDPVLPRDYTPR